MRSHLASAGQLRADEEIGPLQALELALLYRAHFIACLLVAQPKRCFLAELEPADLPAMHVLEHPLAAHSAVMVAAPGESGDYVRGLVEQGSVKGQIVATRRVDDERVFVVDGLHRACAWAELTRRGGSAPLHVAVVETNVESWWGDVARGPG